MRPVKNTKADNHVGKVKWTWGSITDADWRATDEAQARATFYYEGRPIDSTAYVYRADGPRRGIRRSRNDNI